MNQLPSETIPGIGWLGQLQLEFSCRQGSTQLSRSRMQAPLKVQRPFYPEGEVCHSVILHTAGGVVGGDRLSLNIQLHPNAHALITTASAAKVYRSNGVEAKQTAQIQVAEGACLEWFPQETIVFDDALYQQNLRVELADDALWMGWEVTRLGRSARGEKLLNGLWRSRTEIWQQNRPLWIDPQWIQGGSEMLNSPHGLAGCSVVGSFAVVGRSIPVELVEKVRLLWNPKDGQVNKWADKDCSASFPVPHSQFSSPSQAGVTRLMSGLLCRYRGSSTVEARRWFTEVWFLLRPALLNRPGCKPRVWQM